MRLILSVFLPRDRATIPVSRHIVRDALREIGVAEDCAHDVSIAQSEACTNVVDHSGPGDEYEVSVEIDGDRCTIRVVDTGRGFDEGAVEDGATADSERGRGIQLMKALVDRVHFRSDAGAGTAVHLEKTLRFRDDAVFGLRGASNE
ncbi:MAG TPA: ATP-binding protein [Acidimicrobiales bacterium]|nr:ATP-binding protein [Acidimicrobiales bacterium]